MSEDPKEFLIWEGIFTEFPRVSGALGFADPQIIPQLADKMRRDLEGVWNRKPVHDVSIFNQYPLQVLLSVLSAERAISVLDFGGGIGRTYLSVRATAAKPQQISFYVIELDQLTQAGHALFERDKQIHFIKSLDAAPSTIDVVHAGSAFQYVDDWRALLRRFAGLRPGYIVFGNLLAGDIDPCVTMQNYWGHKIPVRFHNFSEVMSELRMLGYGVVFDAFHEQTILGKRRPLPLDNFPENHRLHYGRNVILKRTGGNT